MLAVCLVHKIFGFGFVLLGWLAEVLMISYHDDNLRSKNCKYHSIPYSSLAMIGLLIFSRVWFIVRWWFCTVGCGGRGVDRGYMFFVCTNHTCIHKHTALARTLVWTNLIDGAVAERLPLIVSTVTMFLCCSIIFEFIHWMLFGSILLLFVSLCFMQFLYNLFVCGRGDVIFLISVFCLFVYFWSGKIRSLAQCFIKTIWLYFKILFWFWLHRQRHDCRTT